MRWLRWLSLLSLIPLALLPSGAISAESPSPRETKAQTGQSETPANQTQNTETCATPTIPASKPKDTKQVQTETPKIANNGDGYIKTQVALVNATEHLVYATVGLVVLGAVDSLILAIQICFLWQTSKATAAALHVNRPFLIVKQPRMKGEPQALVPNCVEIDVQNFGTGPADIIDVNCFAEPFDLPPPDPRIDYRTKERLPPYIPVIAAAATVELMRLYFDLGPLAQRVFNEEKRLGIYGEIRYRGGPPDEIYWTRFFWWYFVGVPSTEALARALTKELNART